MLSTLDRYIVRSFLINYLIALSVLVSMYIVLDLFVNFDEFTEEGLPAAQVARNIASFYGYNLFLYFAQLSGVITLFASACTLARMQRSNELTAILAAGTSLYRVAVPVVIAGVLMNIMLIADQEFLIPRFAHKLARPHDDVEGRRTYDVWFVPDANDALLSAVRFNPRDQMLHRMIVIKPDADGLGSEIIQADRAVYDADAEAWILERGTRMHWSTGELGVRPEGDERVAVYRSQLTPDDLLLRQSAQWVQFMPIRKMDRLAAESGQQAARIMQIKHTRFTQPFVNMLLLLLGVPFFLNREPTRVLVNGAMCLLVTGLCFTVAFLGQHVISLESYPALPAWLPIMVFGPVAVWFLDSVRT